MTEAFLSLVYIDLFDAQLQGYSEHHLLACDADRCPLAKDWTDVLERDKCSKKISRAGEWTFFSDKLNCPPFQI